MFRTAFAIAALTAATSVSASPLISSTSDVVLQINAFALGYAAVDTTANTGYIGAGEFRGLISVDGGSASSFLTYCTDIFQTFSWNNNHHYRLVGNGTSPGLTLRQADLLGKLYTLAGLAVDTTDESAAFQLAVWEIVTETGSALGITSGAFRLDSGASPGQRAMADNWLTAVLDVHAGKSYDAHRLFSAQFQDFVWFTELPVVQQAGSGQPTVVPEPSSYALAGLALASLALSRRRRR
jgi:hypothetical protein